MRGLFVSLVVWLLGAASVEAQAGVLLFERSSLRPGLCAALRIQLSGSAEVRCLADGAEESLAERLFATRKRLLAEGASLGVLLERDSDARGVRMYLVTVGGEQAVLAIERIEDRPAPDVDRSLALKVRDAYEVIGFVERTLPGSEASAAAVLAKPHAREASVASPALGEAASEPKPPFWLAFVEFGGGLGLGDATRGLGSALLGIGRTSSRLRYEFGLGARLTSLQRERVSSGSINVVERGPLVAARLAWRAGRIEIGGALQLLVIFAAAEAEGIAGRKQVITPVVGIGPELRVRLFRLAYLRFAPSLEVLTIRRRFTLDHQRVIDRGYVGASLPLSLLISLPLEKTPEGFQP